MRLLRCSDTGEFSLTDDLVGDAVIPPYAILSHTWGSDTEEVTFDDIKNGASLVKAGYEKIRFCGKQASQDNLHYFWIDTCCINKGDKAEFSHAINSMFRWYRNATRCYVYLSDVSSPPLDSNDESTSLTWESALQKSKWFTRGWTLQELLAPTSVEFFSQEWKRLGDKQSLKQSIHRITGIPISALEGGPLSQFSVNERLSWKENRHTKLEEDGAYSLLGIFGVYIAPIYGEGMGAAFKRLIDEINKLENCMQDLRLTDPRDDKRRIEDTKGGLLKDSYCWILNHSDFQRWRDDAESRLLWIKGDPGKGKTMLLCGIIDELTNSMATTDSLSYFFCQATDSRINNATSVLRGLIYLLIYQQPSLISHIRKKHDHAGKALFEDANSWVALTEIFTNILQDPSLSCAYLVVDALDECMVDLPKLAQFVAQHSSSSRVKWVVSSRNWPEIEERLAEAAQKVRLSLELNAESVSMAVSLFIEQRVSQLALKKGYDDMTREAVLEHLVSTSNNTFLWVALVCQNLEKISRRNVRRKIKDYPPGLDSLYERMMQQISSSDEDGDLCKEILAFVSMVYRPITLAELATFVDQIADMADDTESTEEIVNLCGSFLTIREGTIYFVHQSAKDFLLTKMSDQLFPSGKSEIHYVIFSKSLRILSKTLHRNMYCLDDFGHLIEQVEQPDPDPLATAWYSCSYWVDHLCSSDPHTFEKYRVAINDEGAVDVFLRNKYLYWLESLSLCRSISKGVVSMARLKVLIQNQPNSVKLAELVQDAHRFIMYHRGSIESSPLQTYVSALVFSPRRSLIRKLFKKEEPDWITIKPATEDHWSACLQTFEGHCNFVNCVTFSHDSTRLASASADRTIKIWDTSTGERLQTLQGHNSAVKSITFTHDSTQLTSISSDTTVKVWDTRSGDCLQTLQVYSDYVKAVALSHDSTRLASILGDNAVIIWDTSSGESLQTLQEHSQYVGSVAFSHDSTRAASASNDRTAKVWDMSSGECLQTLRGHLNDVFSVTFSRNPARLASASADRTIKIWDTSTGECLQTLEGHNGPVLSVAFSHDSTRLASTSSDRTIKVWGLSSGECLQTLRGHSDWVCSVVFSHDSARLASTSNDNTIKIWDSSGVEGLQTLESHSGYILYVAFSHNSAWLATASEDNLVKIWDANSGECLQTLRDHSHYVRWVVFSHDSTRLASASNDSTVKIWDTKSGECLQTLRGHSRSTTSVAFSHDSNQLASSSLDATVKVWDVSSYECLQTLQGHTSGILSVAFSRDSARLASASTDKTVKIWNASSGECLWTLEGHNDHVRWVTFSHNSTWLASASDDSTVKIWDASKGECLQTHQMKKIRYTNLSFDITDRYIRTDSDSIDISANSRPPLTDSERLNPPDRGLALSADNLWITHNSRKLIWLPSEYRPSFLAISGKTIGVGSGKVWLCTVQLGSS